MIIWIIVIGQGIFFLLNSVLKILNYINYSCFPQSVDFLSHKMILCERACGASVPIGIIVDGKHPKDPLTSFEGFFVFGRTSQYILAHYRDELLSTTINLTNH